MTFNSIDSIFKKVSGGGFAHPDPTERFFGGGGGSADRASKKFPRTTFFGTVQLAVAEASPAARPGLGPNRPSKGANEQIWSSKARLGMQVAKSGREQHQHRCKLMQLATWVLENGNLM